MPQSQDIEKAKSRHFSLMAIEIPSTRHNEKESGPVSLRACRGLAPTQDCSQDSQDLDRLSEAKETPRQPAATCNKKLFGL